MKRITLRESEKKIIPILLNSEAKKSNDLNQWTRKVDVVLAGESAEVEVWGLVIGKSDEKKVLEANIVHVAPKTKSRVIVKSILRGRSSFDFRGNVRIEKGAKGADAYLRSDALLFDEAKIGDDTPALEILEPDVRAGHAATIGKVDENQLFYLMSRGLSRPQAEKLLIEGFVNPVREKLRRPARSSFSAGEGGDLIGKS